MKGTFLTLIVSYIVMVLLIGGLITIGWLGVSVLSWGIKFDLSVALFLLRLTLVSAFVVVMCFFIGEL